MKMGLLHTGDSTIKWGIGLNTWRNEFWDGVHKLDLNLILYIKHTLECLAMHGHLSSGHISSS